VQVADGVQDLAEYRRIARFALVATASGRGPVGGRTLGVLTSLDLLGGRGPQRPRDRDRRLRAGHHLAAEDFAEVTQRYRRRTLVFLSGGSPCW
jgi:hypothetical protein